MAPALTAAETTSEATWAFSAFFCSSSVLRSCFSIFIRASPRVILLVASDAKEPAVGFRPVGSVACAVRGSGKFPGAGQRNHCPTVMSMAGGK